MEETQEIVVRRLVGSWLRDLRKEKGLSQEDLAQKLGVHQSTVAKIEAGRWAFSIDVLTKFCIALDAYLFLLPKDSKDELAVMMQNRWKRAHDNN